MSHQLDITSPEEWEQLGLKWLSGELEITGFGNIQSLNDKQKQFLNDKHLYSLAYGGFASGKTTAFLIKLIYLMLFFPGSVALLGRRTRMALEQNLLPQLWDIYPQQLVEYRAKEGIITFPNGSRVLLYGLDTIADTQVEDLKKAEQKIKGLTLNFVFIDQAEEIDERVMSALTGRLRRPGPFRQVVLTSNPARYWAYDWFMLGKQKNAWAIRMSMLDNRENLPEDYLQDQLSKDPAYVKKWVYGEWTPDTMTVNRNTVFPEEDISSFTPRKPLRSYDGISIFTLPQTGTKYYIGVDPSTGSTGDPFHIAVFSEHGEEVANATGQVPAHVQVERCLHLALLYNKPLVIPESNGVGQAFISLLRENYQNIYRRSVASPGTRRKTEKLGFPTTVSSKMQLIEHTKRLLSAGRVLLRDARTIEQFRIFSYNNSAKAQGASAPPGMHDDAVMASMLALYPVHDYGTRTHLASPTPSPGVAVFPNLATHLTTPGSVSRGSVLRFE